MNPKIKCYNEKKFYKASTVPNVESLIDKNICYENKSSVIFNRTGIVMLKGIAYVIFPFGYRFDDKYWDIQLLLELFENLAERKKMDKEYSDIIDIEYEGNGHSLSISYEIIKDYKENGCIQIENTVKGLNIGGKVNWKKTAKLKTQMFNEDGMPIFTNLFMSRKENDKDALLRSLHMYVINKSIAMFGVLIGIESEYDEEFVKLPVERAWAINFLEAERHLTYNSRLLRVIDLILKFLDSDEKEKSEDDYMSLSTKSFYSVWELMCKAVLRDEFSKFEERIPKPYWDVQGGKRRYTDQIPDILYMEKSTLYVADAKYYNVWKNTPGWGDLVKQHFYEMSLKSVLPEVSKSYNIMIMPADIPGIAKFWGTSSVENIDEFGDIYGILLNTKGVIKNYCHGIKTDYRKELEHFMDERDCITNSLENTCNNDAV